MLVRLDGYERHPPPHRYPDAGLLPDDSREIAHLAALLLRIVLRIQRRDDAFVRDQRARSGREGQDDLSLLVNLGTVRNVVGLSRAVLTGSRGR